MLRCTPPRGWSWARALPCGAARSLLIGPPTLVGSQIRRTGFSPDFLFPEKRFCMGKQKNRLTKEQHLRRPAPPPARGPMPPAAAKSLATGTGGALGQVSRRQGPPRPLQGRFSQHSHFRVRLDSISTSGYVFKVRSRKGKFS